MRKRKKYFVCPYDGNECYRLKDGFRCLVETTHATVRNLKNICGLSEKTIQKLINDGVISPP